MIKLRPSCFFLCILCFSCVHTQLVSSAPPHDLRCSWLTRAPKYIDEQQKLPFQISYACPKNDKTSFQICSNTQNMYERKIICVSGYDEQIHLIIKDIQSKLSRGEITVVVYLYQNNRLQFLGCLNTSKEILETVLRKYDHYFCINDDNVQRFRNADSGWCMNDVIFVPSLRERLITQDLATRYENNIKHEYLYKDLTNNNLFLSESNQDKNKSLFSNLEDDLKKNKFYQFEAPGQTRLVFPCANINLGSNEGNNLFGKVDNGIIDLRYSENEGNQIFPCNWYNSQGYINVIQGKTGNVIIDRKPNLDPNCINYIRTTNNDDNVNVSFKSVCSPTTVGIGTEDLSTARPDSAKPLQSFPSYYSLAKPVNYNAAPQICNLYYKPSSDFYKCLKKTNPWLNCNSHAKVVDIKTNSNFKGSVKTQSSIYTTTNQYLNRNYVIDNTIPNVNLLSNNYQVQKLDSNTKSYYFNGATQDYTSSNIAIQLPYKNEFSRKPYFDNFNTHYASPSLNTDLPFTGASNVNYNQDDSILPLTRLTSRPQFDPSPCEVNVKEPTLTQQMPLHRELNNNWPNYYLNFKPINYKGLNLNLKFNKINNSPSKTKKPDLALLSTQDQQINLNEICQANLNSKNGKYSTNEVPIQASEPSIAPNNRYTKPCDGYNKYLNQNSAYGLTENGNNVIDAIPHKIQNKIYKFDSPKTDSNTGENMQLNFNAEASTLKHFMTNKENCYDSNNFRNNYPSIQQTWSTNPYYFNLKAMNAPIVTSIKNPETGTQSFPTQFKSGIPIITQSTPQDPSPNKNIAEMQKLNNYENYYNYNNLYKPTNTFKSYSQTKIPTIYYKPQQHLPSRCQQKARVQLVLKSTAQYFKPSSIFPGTNEKVSMATPPPQNNQISYPKIADPYNQLLQPAGQTTSPRGLTAYAPQITPLNINNFWRRPELLTNIQVGAKNNVPYNLNGLSYSQNYTGINMSNALNQVNDNYNDIAPHTESYQFGNYRPSGQLPFDFSQISKDLPPDNNVQTEGSYTPYNNENNQVNTPATPATKTQFGIPLNSPNQSPYYNTVYNNEPYLNYPKMIKKNPYIDPNMKTLLESSFMPHTRPRQDFIQPFSTSLSPKMANSGDSEVTLPSPTSYSFEIPYLPNQNVNNNMYKNIALKPTPKIKNAPCKGYNFNTLLNPYTSQAKPYTDFLDLIPPFTGSRSFKTSPSPALYSFQIPSYIPKTKSSGYYPNDFTPPVSDTKPFVSAMTNNYPQKHLAISAQPQPRSFFIDLYFPRSLPKSPLNLSPYLTLDKKPLIVETPKSSPSSDFSNNVQFNNLSGIQPYSFPYSPQNYIGEMVPIVPYANFPNFVKSNTNLSPKSINSRPFEFTWSYTTHKMKENVVIPSYVQQPLTDSLDLTKTPPFTHSDFIRPNKSPGLSSSGLIKPELLTSKWPCSSSPNLQNSALITPQLLPCLDVGKSYPRLDDQSPNPEALNSLATWSYETSVRSTPSNIRPQMQPNADLFNSFSPLSKSITELPVARWPNAPYSQLEPSPQPRPTDFTKVLPYSEIPTTNTGKPKSFVADALTTDPLDISPPISTSNKYSLHLKPNNANFMPFFAMKPEPHLFTSSKYAQPREDFTGTATFPFMDTPYAVHLESSRTNSPYPFNLKYAPAMENPIVPETPDTPKVLSYLFRPQYPQSTSYPDLPKLATPKLENFNGLLPGSMTTLPCSATYSPEYYQNLATKTSPCFSEPYTPPKITSLNLVKPESPVSIFTDLPSDSAEKTKSGSYFPLQFNPSDKFISSNVVVPESLPKILDSPQTDKDLPKSDYNPEFSNLIRNPELSAIRPYSEIDRPQKYYTQPGTAIPSFNQVYASPEPSYQNGISPQSSTSIKPDHATANLRYNINKPFNSFPKPFDQISIGPLTYSYNPPKIVGVNNKHQQTEPPFSIGTNYIHPTTPAHTDTTQNLTPYALHSKKVNNPNSQLPTNGLVAPKSELHKITSDPGISALSSLLPPVSPVSFKPINSEVTYHYNLSNDQTPYKAESDLGISYTNILPYSSYVQSYPEVAANGQGVFTPKLPTITQNKIPQNEPSSVEYSDNGTLNDGTPYQETLESLPNLGLLSYNYPTSASKLDPVLEQPEDTSNIPSYPNYYANKFFRPRPNYYHPYNIPNPLDADSNNPEITPKIPEITPESTFLNLMYPTVGSNISPKDPGFNPTFSTSYSPQQTANDLYLETYQNSFPSQASYPTIKDMNSLTPSYSVLSSPEPKYTADLESFTLPSPLSYLLSQPPSLSSPNFNMGTQNIYPTNYGVQTSSLTFSPRPSTNVATYNHESDDDLQNYNPEYYSKHTSDNANPNYLNKCNPVTKTNISPLNDVNIERFAINSLLKCNVNPINKNNQIADLLRDKEVNIDVGNVCLVKYPPNGCDNEFIVQTNKPKIYMKAWRSKIKIIKAKIVLDESEYNVTNFMPIVKEPDTFDHEAVQNVVKDIVTQSYGEPIVLRGMYRIYNPFAVVCNVDDVKLSSGGNNVLWPTLDESTI